MPRDTSHELEKYEGPSDEKNVQETRCVWCIPEVHQNNPYYAHKICGSCNQHHMEMAGKKKGHVSPIMPMKSVV